MTAANDKQREIEVNYQAFKSLLPDLLKSHSGKFAVLRQKKIIEFFDTPRDALIFAIKAYPDNMYSIQEVTNRVIDLGWFSYANADPEIRV